MIQEYKIMLMYNSAIQSKAITLYNYNTRARLFRPAQPSSPLATGQQLASVELGGGEKCGEAILKD